MDGEAASNRVNSLSLGLFSALELGVFLGHG
jgi:hypothetical protein